MVRTRNIDRIKANKIRLSVGKKSYVHSVVSEPTQSSSTASQILIQPFSDAGRFGWYNLRASASWKYYKEISVIRDAVDLGADNFVTVPFAIKDHKTDKMFREFDRSVPATEILELMKKPNQDVSESEFKKSAYTSFNVCGDTFMLITQLEEDGIPQEIYYINPKNVSETTNLNEQATSYQINTGNWRGRYDRKELSDDRVVYINPVTENQLWIMKNFNPDSSRSSRGFSKLSSVFFEIESHNGINKHNNSTLRNGVRPSGAAIPNTPENQTSANFTDEQMEEIKANIQAFYGGYNNAGNVMVLDGIKEFIELSKSNKDMDFKDFLPMMKEQIYNNLRIPLPMVTGKIMTFSNFEESKFMLYDMNIIPFSTCYAEEIDRFLMPKYDDTGRYEYVVDMERIPALEVRKLAKIKEFKNDLTSNERRELIDYEERPDGDGLQQTNNMRLVADNKSIKEIQK